MPKTIFKSSKSIIAITSCWIEVGSSGSQPNSKIYGEKDVRKTCQLHQYPMINHGNYKFQYLVWPF